VFISEGEEGESTVKHIDGLYVAIGAFYLVAGTLLGIVMGIRQDFQLVPLHAHINLVGFAAHSVFGFVHKAWPELQQGAIAVAQFWLFVVGAPVLMLRIAISIRANSIALAVVGAILVFLGALLYLLIVGRNLYGLYGNSTD
jgi:hypothetical protein